MQAIKSDFKQWIGEQLQSEDFIIHPLRNDASFRSYYRVKHQDKSFVVMDAPPDKEKTDLFVEIAKAWHRHALPVPHILGWEKQKGYVLLSDFGDTLLLDVLNSENVDKYYQQAIDLILHLQLHANYVLPAFDEAHIRMELGLFSEWFCEKLLGLTLSSGEKELLENVNLTLIRSCQEQPQITIHRDYHSRNLMLLNEAEHFGLIDFQDAMVGPLTYDLVSILKDCYIQWPRENIEKWVKLYFDQVSLIIQSLPPFEKFLEWFDATGLQRHLKVLGVFSRLKIRDNKPQYIHDMPRIMRYVFDVTSRYDCFASFDRWLRERVLPVLEIRLAENGVAALVENAQ